MEQKQKNQQDAEASPGAQGIMQKVSSPKVVATQQCSSAVMPAKGVKVEVFEDGITIAEFMRLHPNAQVAINGGFFDVLQDGCMIPTGFAKNTAGKYWLASPAVGAGEDEARAPFAQKAQREASWMSVFFINADMKAGIMPAAEFDEALRPKEYDDIFVGSETGPALIRGGKLVPEEYGARMSANKELRRSAVGIKENGDVIILSSKEGMTFTQLASMLVELGAKDAVALDGGVCTSFEARGESDAQILGTRVNTVIYWEKD